MDNKKVSVRITNQDFISVIFKGLFITIRINKYKKNPNYIE